MMNKYELKNCETWIFDLDNTLYPVSANLFDQIDRRMCSYISNFLGITKAEAYKLQKQYFRKYGTSLRGLMANHKMDPLPYLKYVHDIDLAVIERDELLKKALDSLPGMKFVFTNSVKNYANKVLIKLGIKDCFDGVFDIADAEYIPKPEPSVYNKVTKRFSFDPKKAVMVEDIVRNLIPAANLGMKTIWVQTNRPWGNTNLDEIKPDFTTQNLPIWLAELSGL